MKVNLEEVSLIITTRNRVAELLKTVKHCISIGLNEDQIYVIDDASTDNTFAQLRVIYPGIFIFRNDSSKGLIANRNFLMNQAKGEYMLSLDDDSHIRSADDIAEAVAILASDPTLAIFGFKPYEQLLEPPLKSSLPDTLREVRTYIGCGHLMKRDAFTRLGLYREEFEFYCEELDYSIRAYRAGYKVVTKDNLVVHHRIDWPIRNQQFQDDLNNGVYGAVNRSVLGFSNNLVVVALYFPFPFNHLFVGYYTLLRFKNFYLKTKDREGFRKGWERFVSFKSYYEVNRRPLSWMLFFRWIQLKVR